MQMISQKFNVRFLLKIKGFPTHLTFKDKETLYKEERSNQKFLAKNFKKQRQMDHPETIPTQLCRFRKKRLSV